MNPAVFREYDIRGRVGDDLDEDAAFLVGQAFGTYLRRRDKRTAVVGRDNRTSSDGFAAAAGRGLRATGIDVTDLGLVATPVFYYARLLYSVDGGVMVTGSHNPPDENGFKLAFGSGTLFGPDIQELRETIERGDFTSGRGRLSFRDPKDPYLAMLQARLAIGPGSGRPLRVAVDAGNGTVGPFALRLLASLGCETVPLYCDPDPAFPHHFPDPVVPANLTDLARTVRDRRCDLGVAYDGDGDRLGVVDDLGNVVWGDILMILFWREILPKHPGATALVEVKCSQALIDEIRRLGGHPVFCRTGHSLIKARMRETGAPFAGEMSGHFFFADEYFGYDDALYATGRLVRLVAGAGRSLAKLLADVPRYPATPEVRVPCPDQAKFRVVAALRESLALDHPVIDTDGVRAAYPGGWGLVRASNTQACLVVRCEGDSPETLERIKTDLAARLRRHPEVGPVDWGGLPAAAHANLTRTKSRLRPAAGVDALC